MTDRRAGGPCLRRVAVLAVLLAGVVAGAALAARRGTLPPRRLVAAGNEAVDRGDTAVARGIVRRLENSGAAAEARLLRARLLLARGFAQPALDAVAGIGGRPDLDTLRRLVEGEAAQRSGQFAAARSILGGVVAADPGAVAAHRLLASLAYDTGAIPEALTHLDAVRRLAPGDPRPVRLMALIHSDYELYAEAVSLYAESLARDPHQPDRDDLLAEMAACQVKLRRYDAALATLAEAAGTPAERLLEAECRLALGETERARTLVEGVLAERPDEATALVLLGTIRLEDGAADAAVEVLERAVGLQPRDYQARLTLARALATLGRDADARREQAEAEAIRTLRAEFAELHQRAWDAPRDPAVRLELAKLAEALGRNDLAKVWREAAAAVAGTGR